MNHQNLEEKVVVVTGAGGRLGRRLVARLAEAGARIAAVDLRAENLTLHDGVQGFGADLTDDAAVRAVFAQIAAAWGSIDALVHVAGMWTGKPLLDTTLADWRTNLDVNLTSAFLCFREAIRYMDGSGRLVAMASGQGTDRGRAEQGAYSAAKAGVMRLVEAVAEEYKGTGITTHALAPSTILFDETGKGVPAEHLIDLILYLCADPAAASTSGATLRAYGSA